MADHYIDVTNPITDDSQKKIKLVDNGDGTYSIASIGMDKLVPEVYDYIGLSYSGNNVIEAVYKTGGASGTTVATLTLAYSGNNVTSVTKT